MYLSDDGTDALWSMMAMFGTWCAIGSSASAQAAPTAARSETAASCPAG